MDYQHKIWACNPIALFNIVVVCDSVVLSDFTFTESFTLVVNGYLVNVVLSVFKNQWIHDSWFISSKLNKYMTVVLSASNLMHQ